MGTTQVAVVNEALQFIAAQTTITSLTDGTPAAGYASIVYEPTVQLLLREIDPSFARTTAALSLIAQNLVHPWAYGYTYPADCIRLRQVAPQFGYGDAHDPQPVRSNVAFNAGVKVILTNQPNAQAVYTTSLVTEDMWDSTFADAVARRLANPLAMALSGRPDFAEMLLQQSAQMAATTYMVDENMIMRSA